MSELISCNCVPPVKKYAYGSSQPVDLGDTRTEITYREYYNDQTINEFELPVCVTIGEEAFRNSSIKEIYAPNCITIGDRAFYSADEVVDLDFSSVTTIGTEAFANISKTYKNSVSINIENVVTVGERAFYEASPFLFSPSSVDYPQLILPKCKEIKSFAFGGHNSAGWPIFHRIELMSIEKIYEMAFRRIILGGTANRYAEIHLGPNCTYIEGNSFYNVQETQYSNLYVYAVNPPRLTGRLNGGLGEDWIPNNVFVPAQSVDTYKTATNWDHYASVIQAMPT